MLQRITDALAQKFDWEFVALVAVNEPRTAFVCEAIKAITQVGGGHEVGQQQHFTHNQHIPAGAWMVQKL